uniref:Uncharacterized protein n=1 Tax=Meloidogyne javanica TaxID=6303 RepID=A0A915MT84_MELJA
MPLNNGNDLLAAIHHKGAKDEKSTSSILLNSLRFKQAQERDELEKLFLKDRISCKNDELSHDVGSVSRSDVCSGPSPHYGQRIINGQHYEPLPTFPVTSHQQFGHQQMGNFQFQQSLMSNYYQQFPQLWYQQAVQLQLNYNADLSQVNGQSLRNLSNQRHIADKQFYNGL